MYLTQKLNYELDKLAVEQGQTIEHASENPPNSSDSSPGMEDRNQGYSDDGSIYDPETSGETTVQDEVPRTEHAGAHPSVEHGLELQSEGPILGGAPAYQKRAALEKQLVISRLKQYLRTA
jgi:hypothetical protein